MGAETLSLAFIDAHPEAAARVIERLAPADAAPLLAAGPARRIAPMALAMAPFHTARCLEAMAPDAAAAILGALPVPLGAAVLRHLDAVRRRALLGDLPAARAALLRTMIAYPEQTVGAWMDPDTPMLRADRTAADALGRLRAMRDPDRADRVYVTDAGGRPAGVVSAGRLLRADPEAALGTLAVPAPAVLSVRASVAAIEPLSAWDATGALPVTEWGGRLVGALHRADLVRALAGGGAQGEPPALGEAFGVLLRGYGAALAALVETGLGAARGAGRAEGTHDGR